MDQNYMYDVVVITCISRRGNLHSRRRNTKASVVVTVVIFVVVTCNAAGFRLASISIRYIVYVFFGYWENHQSTFSDAVFNVVIFPGLMVSVEQTR